MNKLIKICKSTQTNNLKHISHNKLHLYVNNKNMKKDSKPNVFVMPPQISDADITALFNGIVSVVKKKVELEKKAEILTVNLNLEQTLKQLKEKQAECNRLKNEIVNLQAQLDNLQSKHANLS